MNVIEHPDVESLCIKCQCPNLEKKIILAILKTNRRTFVEVTWQTVCTSLYQFG